MGEIPVVDKTDEWEGPVPRPTGVTEPFWEGSLDGEFRLQECDDCGRSQFYPRLLCSHCGGRSLTWTDASGEGEVHSYTVSHIPGEPGFDEYAPYAVAVVELAEGPRMTAFVPGDPDDVDIGTPVEARFWQVSEDAAVPVFVPA